jgi:toxin FitB
MFLLDTNAVSEMRKVRNGRANPGVSDWAQRAPAARMFISAVTVLELELGVLLAERADPPKGAVLRAWLDEGVTTAFADRVLPMDERVSRRAARLHVPDPTPFRDAVIGATALVHGMTVVTRNRRDFDRFSGLDVLDPWS